MNADARPAKTNTLSALIVFPIRVYLRKALAFVILSSASSAVDNHNSFSSGRQAARDF